eukprot:scaffold34183_cov58-Phaeocystis_antarctica.AAC.2
MQMYTPSAKATAARSHTSSTRCDARIWQPPTHVMYSTPDATWSSPAALSFPALIGDAPRSGPSSSSESIGASWANSQRAWLTRASSDRGVP